MDQAASMDGMVGSFAAAAWNYDRSVRWLLLVGILCLGIWGLLLRKERCLSLGLDGDFGYLAYAGKVFEFGFEWGFWVWLGFGVLLVFPQDWDFLPGYLNLSQCFGLLKLPITSTPISIPGLPVLELEDMPSFISMSNSYPSYLELLANQFSNSEKADAVLVNTFYELEVGGGGFHL